MKTSVEGELRGGAERGTRSSSTASPPLRSLSLCDSFYGDDLRKRKEGRRRITLDTKTGKPDMVEY